MGLPSVAEGTMAQDSASGEELTFEQALQQLEAVVRKLEEGDLGLTEALAEYEAGVRHLKQCHAALAQAERKIELLSGVDAAGNPVTRPFDDAEMTLEQKAESRSRRRSAKTTKSAPPPPSDQDVDDPPGLF
jgi:exodeoxyribonuclease VII small subunit